MMNTKRTSGMLLIGVLLLGGASARANDIVGSWDVVAESRLGQANALYTFARDGTFTMAGDAPSIRTPGHGVWGEVGNNNVALTFKRLRFNLESGAFEATLYVRANLMLGDSGNTFGGDFQLDIYDPDGHRVLTVTGTLSGTRIALDPL